MGKLIDLVNRVESVLDKTEAAFFRSHYIHGEPMGKVAGTLSISDPETFNRSVLRKLRGGYSNVPSGC